MFKKLKEKIEFLKWAYVNRNIKSQEINAYIRVNNIEPKLICVERIIPTDELNMYEPYVKKEMLQKMVSEFGHFFGMEKEDLLNGTSKVIIRCYISPFSEDIK